MSKYISHGSLGTAKIWPIICNNFEFGCEIGRRRFKTGSIRAIDWHVKKLVPKLVTLNDLEPRRLIAVIRYHSECVSLENQLWCCVILLEGRPTLYCLRQKCSPKNLVLGCIWLISLFRERLPRTSALTRRYDRHPFVAATLWQILRDNRKTVW